MLNIKYNLKYNIFLVFILVSVLFFCLNQRAFADAAQSQLNAQTQSLQQLHEQIQTWQSHSITTSQLGDYLNQLEPRLAKYFSFLFDDLD